MRGFIAQRDAREPVMLKGTVLLFFVGLLSAVGFMCCNLCNS